MSASLPPSMLQVASMAATMGPSFLTDSFSEHAGLIQTAVTDSIRGMMPPSFEPVYPGMNWMNIPSTFCQRLLDILVYLQSVLQGPAASAELDSAVEELRTTILGIPDQEKYLITIWHIRGVYGPADALGQRLPFPTDMFDLLRMRHTHPSAVDEILVCPAIREAMDAYGLTKAYEYLSDEQLEKVFAAVDVINGTAELFEMLPPDMNERLEAVYSGLDPDQVLTEEQAAAAVRGVLGVNVNALLSGEEPLNAVTIERLFGWATHIAGTHTAKKFCNTGALAMMDQAIANKDIIIAACGSQSVPDLVHTLQQHFLAGTGAGGGDLGVASMLMGMLSGAGGAGAAM
jgi:hypothetical protein